MNEPNVIRKMARNHKRAFRRFTEPIEVVDKSDVGDESYGTFQAVVTDTGGMNADDFGGNVDYDIEILLLEEESIDDIDASTESNVTADEVTVYSNNATYTVQGTRRNQYFQVLECAEQ